MAGADGCGRGDGGASARHDRGGAASDFGNRSVRAVHGADQRLDQAGDAADRVAVFDSHVRAAVSGHQLAVHAARLMVGNQSVRCWRAGARVLVGGARLSHHVHCLGVEAAF